MTHPHNIRRLLFITLATLALAVFAGLALGFQPPGEYEWIQTPEAQIRTQAGECYVEGASLQEVCVQWCVITPEGDILPQNEFRCLPLDN